MKVLETIVIVVRIIAKKILGKTDPFRHCETTPVASYGARVDFLESPGALRESCFHGLDL